MICLFLLLYMTAAAQPVKNIEHFQQTWLGYFSQARLSSRWGLWTDLHLRTKDNFTRHLSQVVLRGAIIYYLNDKTKLMAGYARTFHYPGDNHKAVTQPEHRLWQQLQWHTSFTKNRITQAIRLEERFRPKILNDSTLSDENSFNWRLRYNLWYEIPLVKNGIQPKSLSFIVNDEIHINFGNEIVYNYFDQNRFFLGLKYQFTKSTNVQAGYLNLFQQLSAGNKYKNINAVRIFVYQSLDWRKKNKRPQETTLPGPSS